MSNDIIEIYNGTCMFCMQRALIRHIGHRDEQDWCDCDGAKAYNNARLLLSGLASVAVRNLERTQSKHRLKVLMTEVRNLENRLTQLGEGETRIMEGNVHAS